MIISEERLRPLLAQVQKPGRYVGREFNSLTKDWEHAAVRLALAYPDTYEIGMSNLGLAILYDLVNRRPDMLAERVYTPWADMQTVMRAAQVPLFSLETRHPLSEFDVLGFSLQHELNYTNVLSMLDLAGLPLQAAERDVDAPLVIAGGSCTYNPEPMATFFDLYVIGEGEEVLLELLEAVRSWKVAHRPGGRAALLRKLARIEGAYVPSLYDIAYHVDGTLAGATPREEGIPARVRKRILARLGPVPTHPIVCTTEVIHDRATVEIQRGCSRGCRFCQAGMIYRPVRERPVAETLDAIDDLVAHTGYGEVSLISLSSSDHSGIADIIAQTNARHAAEGLSVSLPSLRIDSFSVSLAEMIQTTRRTGFTFAPEAGSQRLRDVINKGVTEEDLLRTTEAVFASGWNRIKLYFMLGLPTETDEDILEIARLVREIAARGRRIRGRQVDLGVSVSTFVPKPHTPFQWAPLATHPVVERRQALLRNNLRGRGIELSWAEWDDTWLEAILARGDRRLGPMIERAWRLGARFDAWTDHFRPDLWQQALAEEGLDPDHYVTRPRTEAEHLPWDTLDVGVTRRFLWREYQRALAGGSLTADCRETCHACGVREAFAAVRDATPACDWGCPVDVH